MTSVHKQIRCLATSNTRTINSIKTIRTIYLTLLRSHLGYATQVCTPQLLFKLEKPQRRATKYFLKLPFTSSACYNSRLQTLHLLIPICYWHEFLDMVHFFKAANGLTSSSFFLQAKTTRCTRSRVTRKV